MNPISGPCPDCGEEIAPRGHMCSVVRPCLRCGSVKWYWASRADVDTVVPARSCSECAKGILEVRSVAALPAEHAPPDAELIAALARLEAAGWKVGNASEFLGLPAEHAPPRDIRNEFTLCEETGALAIHGACPTHHGDACLRAYQPVTFVQAAWRGSRPALAGSPELPDTFVERAIQVALAQDTLLPGSDTSVGLSVFEASDIRRRYAERNPGRAGVSEGERKP